MAPHEGVLDVGPPLFGPNHGAGMGRHRVLRARLLIDLQRNPFVRLWMKKHKRSKINVETFMLLETAVTLSVMAPEGGGGGFTFSSSSCVSHWLLYGSAPSSASGGPAPSTQFVSNMSGSKGSLCLTHESHHLKHVKYLDLS